jgi:glycosyltransferase involved in cell wall biosynthesis
VLIGARGWKYRGVDQAIEEEGIADAVTFAGYLPQNELPNWYRAADLFVYPSLYEGFGLPPLEAMACGTPVITSNVSSLPEVVGDAALTVDPTDVEMLADAIARVLRDDARREQMRVSGLAQSAKFDWAITARETAQVYREILE